MAFSKNIGANGVRAAWSLFLGLLCGQKWEIHFPLLENMQDWFNVIAEIQSFYYFYFFDFMCLFSSYAENVGFLMTLT